MATIQAERLEALGRPSVVHLGGAGEPVLLVHGGWSGAAIHWDRVWGPLSERYRVIAPELPGIGDLSQPGLGSIGGYARWLAAVLDAAGVRAASLVGNSLGATAVWSLAAQSPARCRALVLVDGTPMQRMPALVRALGRFPPTRAAMRRVLLRNTFSPRARSQAVAFPDQLPAELFRVFEDSSPPPQLEALLDVLVRGGDEARPGVTPLLLWGAHDRFRASDPTAARRLRAAIPGSRLVVVPDAGHLPQLENPAAFLAVLMPFLDERLGTAAPAQP